MAQHSVRLQALSWQKGCRLGAVAGKEGWQEFSLNAPVSVARMAEAPMWSKTKVTTTRGPAREPFQM